MNENAINEKIEPITGETMFSTQVITEANDNL